MSYIDGFVVPVPADNKQAYRDMAQHAAGIFREYGALQVVEAWGQDVPRGEHTDFYRATAATEGENIVFSWIVWPSREARDAAWEKLMQDERMKPPADMPFDGKRMFWGGFEPIVDTGA